MHFRLRRFILVATGSIAIVILLWLATVQIAFRYRVSKGVKNIELQTREMERKAAEDAATAMKDLEGGLAPQETIALYIKALRARDFTQASKYFVGENQEKTLQTLRAMTPEALERAINLSAEAAAQPGEFGMGRESYTIREPLLFHLVRYPNGVWKIVEW